MKYRIGFLSILFAFCLHGETIAPTIVSDAWENAKPSLVDAGLDYADDTSLELCENPARGPLGGRWRAAAPGKTEVLSLTGDNTPLWLLSAFSAGNDYGHKGLRRVVDKQPDGTATTNFVSCVGGEDLPIDDATLAAWSETLDNARANGALLIPRFGYDLLGVSGCEPADFDMMLTHIRQIAGVLNAHTDVVIALECGMIGMWGEMHSSKYEDREHMSTVIRTWLECLDPSIKLLVRTPKFLFGLLDDCQESADLLARQDEFDPTRRIGFYDDGYLGTAWNYGTYNNDGRGNMNRAAAMEYLRERGNLPYGGELGSVSAEAAGRVLDWFATNGWGRAGGWNLVQEWYDSHLSYLRGIYGGVGVALASRNFTKAQYAFEGMPELSEWEGRSLSDFMAAHMGYRFVLRASRLTSSVAPCGTLALEFELENTGFGNLFLPSVSEVVLRHETEDGVKTVALSTEFDLGAEVPSARRRTIRLSLPLPDMVTEGRWTVCLRTHIPVRGDPPKAVRNLSIRFANKPSQWNEELAANKLGEVEVRKETGRVNDSPPARVSNP